jgi:UPF0716 family protein affecting phage T7 exclusion
MNSKTLFSPPVLVGLWAVRVILVLMLPGLTAKLTAIALMLLGPLCRRLVARQIRARLESHQQQEGIRDEYPYKVR